MSILLPFSNALDPLLNKTTYEFYSAFKLSSLIL
jgi:hypothetical protein